MQKGSGQPQNHWELPSTIEAVEQLGQQLLGEVKKSGFSEQEVFAIHLALEEALVNAVRHGNASDPSKKVFVDCKVDSQKFEIAVEDQGPGFKPEQVPDPRVPENLYKCSGRGILLIKSYMDEVDFNERGNRIHMVKHKTAEKS